MPPAYGECHSPVSKKSSLPYVLEPDSMNVAVDTEEEKEEEPAAGKAEDIY